MRGRALKPKFGRARKGTLRSRLPKILAALVVVGLVVATPFVARSAYRYVAARPCFVITELRVSGLKYVQLDDFMRYIGDPRGHSVLDMDVEGTLRKVKLHPWIKDASVRREFPGTIRVEVLERTPAALAETGSGRLLMDEDGQALATVTGDGWNFLPVVRCQGADWQRPTGDKAAKEFTGALELMRCIKKDQSERLAGASLVIAEDGFPRMLLDGAVVKVGPGPYEDKVRRLAEVAGDIQKRGICPSLIDLRFPGKVVVKGGRLPQPGQAYSTGERR
jgi:cell division septal protein FtsQ